MPDPQSALQASLGTAYSIVRELGGAGMSRVFLAEDIELGRQVVVKMLAPETASAVGIDRFRREIRMAAGLQHPHILPVLAAGQAGDALYYTMPFVAGEDLKARLARDRQLPVEDAVRLVCEIADALAFAHGKGIVHRDVKPANILLSDGHALLTDFGIAKALEPVTDSLTATGMSLGTPTYMAPEQIAGAGDVDGRADEYALACVAYELLTGSAPFAGASAQAVVAQHMTAPFPRATHSRPDVPRAVDDVLQKAAAKAPADRYATLGDFSAALRAALAPAAPASSRTSRRWILMAAPTALVAALAIAGVWRSTRRAAATDPKTFAVLPLAVVGGDTSNLYYADGITDALIGALSGIPGLHVTSRSSTFAFRGSHLTARQVGESLHVSALLEGSVQRVGDRVRIAVDLTDPQRDGVLWHKSFDGTRADVFGMQDSIAKAVVAALEVRLADGATQSPPKPEKTNPEAYDAYLRGRYFQARRDSAGLTKSLDYLSSAIALDSTFAPAYAALAEVYTDMTVFGLTPPTAVQAQAEAASLRSMQLGESTAEGHTARGFVAYMLEWDIPTAKREFARALAIDPRYTAAHLYRATMDLAIGDTVAALRDGREAVRLDPYSLIANTRLATFLLFNGRPREAAAQAQHVREMDSTFTQARAELVRADLALGDCASALREVSTLPRLRLATLPVHGLAYAHCGRPGDAAAELSRFDEQRRHGTYVSHMAYAMVSAALGRNDEAIAHLDSALTEHTWALMLMRTEPEFDRLRSDPRFAAVLRKMP